MRIHLSLKQISNKYWVLWLVVRDEPVAMFKMKSRKQARTIAKNAAAVLKAASPSVKITSKGFRL